MRTTHIKEWAPKGTNFADAIARTHVILPDGTTRNFVHESDALKYCVLYYGYYTKSWIIHGMTDTFSNAVKIYNSVDSRIDYYCIAEILGGQRPNDVMLHEWYAPIPTIYGFIKEYGTISSKLCIYTNKFASDYTKSNPNITEITQSLSNAFVNSKVYTREYYKDCVVLKVNPKEKNGYGFTFQYGKYYFLGYIKDEDAKEFAFPHNIQKEQPKNWMQITLLEAIAAFNERKTIKMFDRCEKTERIFDNHSSGFWESKQLSFSELFTSKWYVEED